MTDLHNTTQENESLHHSNSHNKQSEVFSSIKKVLKPFLFALTIIILLIISIFIVRTVPKYISSLQGNNSGSVFSFLNKKIKFTDNPKQINSGEILEFKWQNKLGSESNAFWQFKCTEGITVLYTLENGEKRPVICETLFPLGNIKNGIYGFIVQSNNPDKTKLEMTISLYKKNEDKAISSDKETVSVIQKKEESVNVSENQNTYTPSAYTASLQNTQAQNTANTAQNQTNTTVSNGSLITQNNSNPYTSEAYNPNPYQVTNNTSTNYNYRYQGSPDLHISLQDVRVISFGNQILRSISDARYGDRIQVRFRVTNTGTSPSGTWSVSGTLPTINLYNQNYSAYGPSLNPGSIYEMTIAFDSFDGQRDIFLNLISQNDLSTGNNALTVPLPNVSSYNYNNNYNYSDYYDYYNYNNNYTYSSGKADLRVRIVDIGEGSRYSYRSTDNIDEDDTLIIKFVVENIGGDDSERFDIEAKVPSEDDNTYEIRNTSSLSPGERREYIIAIDDLESGNHTIRIEVDSDDDVNEKSESNNTDSERVEIDN